MKKYALSLLAVIVAVAAGYWLVITPDNPLTRAFQRKISDIDSRIIVGPYPNKSDFRLLRDHQVNLIVSLLDPRLPYENTLLEEERKIAQQYGIRLLNFPMASIIGYKFGENYENNAIAAADVIANTSEKVYLHCYLGMHRIQVVRDILNTRGIPAGTYTIRHGEREMSRRLLDAADIDYHAGRYEESLNTLAKIAQREDSRCFHFAGLESLPAWSQARGKNNF